MVEANRNEDLTVIGGEGSQPALEAIIEEEGVSADANAHASAWSAWGAADEINRFLNKEEAVPEGLGFVARNSNLPKGSRDVGGRSHLDDLREVGEASVWIEANREDPGRVHPPVHLEDTD